MTMFIPRIAQRLRRRNRLIVGGPIVMVLIFAVSIYAFTRSDWHPARPDQELEPGNVPGSGMAVRTEALHLWLPEAFSELAKRDSSLPRAHTRAEMQRYLEIRKQERLWYALTLRMYPANGRSTDITYIRRPYDDPREFAELLDLIGELSGDISVDPTADFSNVTIQIVPDALSKNDPHEVIAELLRHH